MTVDRSNRCLSRLLGMDTVGRADSNRLQQSLTVDARFHYGIVHGHCIMVIGEVRQYEV